MANHSIPRFHRSRPRVERLEGRRLLATFTVINTDDSGPGSLRQAIISAGFDPSPGVSSIVFAIPGGGVHTIAPTSALPPIIHPVDLDATTQAGYAGSPRIVLDGSGAGQANGISLGIGADGSMVRGLAVDRFQLDGIGINGANDVAIRGNYVGVDPTGTIAEGNGGGGIGNGGFYVTSRTVIGGTGAGDGNVISGNGGIGVFDGGDLAVIQGNRIGTDASGTHALGNTIGIYLDNRTTVGGTSVGAGNLISGNRLDGLDIHSHSDRNLIEGNLIGTDASGTRPLGNGGDGIYVGASAYNSIGGTVPGAGNVISGNGGDGILVTYEPNPSSSPLGGFIGAPDQRIEGNVIGTDRRSLLDLGNRGNGISFRFMASGTIGGTAPGAGNLIAHNHLQPISFPGGQTVTPENSSVVGNTFGSETPLADIDLTVSGSNPKAKYGDPIAYTFTVTNHGPDTATNIRLQLIRDGFNYPVLVVSGPAQGDAGQVGFLSIASLAAGASTTLDVQSRGSQFNPYLPAIDYFGIALVGLDQFDTDSTNNSASAPLDTAHLSGLTVTSAVTPRASSTSSGETVTFTVANLGEGIATNVRLALAGSISSGTVEAIRVSQGTGPSPGDFTSSSSPFADLGELDPGASATVSVDLAPTIPVAFNLTATPSSDFRYLAPALTVPVASTVVDLTVSAVASPTPIRAGENAGYTFKITNPGSTTATGVYVVLDLSALSNVQFEPGQSSITPLLGRPGYYLATLGSIAPGSMTSITFQAPTAHAGLLVVSAAAGLDQTDPNPTDNLVSAAVVVAPAVQLAAIEPRTQQGRVTALELYFDVPLVKSKAENLSNYHLSSLNQGDRHGTKLVAVPLHLQSARLDRNPSTVLIRLAHPLPGLGTPITLRIGGPGSVGLTSQAASGLIADPISTTISTVAKRQRR